MGNSRTKERFELALDAKQICAVLIGSLVILGGTFVLGMSVGRQATGVAPQPITAPKDALARLDEPLPAREEPAPDLKAHQALTDARPIDKTLPVPAVKPTTVSVAAAAPVVPVAPTLTSDPQTGPAPVDPVLEKPAVAGPAPAPAPAAKPEPAKAAVAATSAPATKPSNPPAHAVVAAKPVAKPAHPAQADAHHKVAAKHGSYAIQVGAASHRADAERLAKKLSGRNARVVSANVPGKGHVYRVLVGSYDSQDAAKRQLAALSRTGVHGIVTAVR